MCIWYIYTIYIVYSTHRRATNAWRVYRCIYLDANVPKHPETLIKHDQTREFS